MPTRGGMHLALAMSCLGRRNILWTEVGWRLLSTVHPMTLLHALEKAEASLALTRSRIEGDLSTRFTGADAKLAPGRLLCRLHELQVALPELEALAAANDASRREILDELRATCQSNQERVCELARRAGASIDEQQQSWQQANDALPAALQLCRERSSPSSSQLSRGERPPAAADARTETERVAAPRPAVQPTDLPERPLPPPPEATVFFRNPTHTSLAEMVSTPSYDPCDPCLSQNWCGSKQVTELQWLRLDKSLRASLTLDEINDFWSLLRGLFVRREVKLRFRIPTSLHDTRIVKPCVRVAQTRELQAAQLLALGVRMSEQNNRKLKILEGVGAASQLVAASLLRSRVPRGFAP